MLIDVLYTIGGFVLLLFGADYLVRGAVALARRFGVSPLIVGLTIVALGTSLPELVVTLRAAYGGEVGMAVGNVVGSNIANILLILGAGALVHPIACTRRTLTRDGLTMLGAMGLFVGFAIAGTLGLWHGLAAIALLAAYLYASYRSDAGPVAAVDEEDVHPVHGPLPKILLAVAAGLAAVPLGAELLVRGAVGIARSSGVSEEVIGLTLVAFGTSVPELATTVVAGLRRHADVALGNVLGSNLFNTLGILGVVAVLIPFDVPEKIVRFDLWAMLAAGILALILLRTRWRLDRPEAAFMLVLYVAFIVVQFFGIGGPVTAAAVP
jgi:cation:H+ antiporter